MREVLSPEEVAALFQGLTEEVPRPADLAPLSEMVYPAPHRVFSELWQVLKFQKISDWLAGLRELQWPQL